MKFNSEVWIVNLLKLIQFFYRLVFFYLPSPLALFLLYTAGKLIYFFTRLFPYKKEIAENIEKVFPKRYSLKQRLSFAGQLIKNISFNIVEMIAYPFLDKKIIDSLFQVEGLENLDWALKEKNGAILIFLHTGNYENIPIFLSNRGYAANVIVRQPVGNKIFDFLAKCRACRGAKLINIETENMYTEALAALRKNETVVLAVDTGALEGKHLYLKIFDRQLPVALGWKVLAQRSGAPVIPVFSQRKNKKNRIMINKSFSIPKDDPEAQIILQKSAEIFASFIEKNPANWAFFLSPYEVNRLLA